jgi:hypothetical protein
LQADIQVWNQPVEPPSDRRFWRTGPSCGWCQCLLHVCIRLVNRVPEIIRPETSTVGQEMAHAPVTKQNGGRAFLASRAGPEGREHAHKGDLCLALAAAASFQHGKLASRCQRSRTRKKLTKATKAASSNFPVAESGANTPESPTATNPTTTRSAVLAGASGRSVDRSIINPVVCPWRSVQDGPKEFRYVLSVARGHVLCVHR